MQKVCRKQKVQKVYKKEKWKNCIRGIRCRFHPSQIKHFCKREELTAVNYPGRKEKMGKVFRKGTLEKTLRRLQKPLDNVNIEKPAEKKALKNLYKSKFWKNTKKNRWKTYRNKQIWRRIKFKTLKNS